MWQKLSQFTFSIISKINNKNKFSSYKLSQKTVLTFNDSQILIKVIITIIWYIFAKPIAYFKNYIAVSSEKKLFTCYESSYNIKINNNDYLEPNNSLSITQLFVTNHVQRDKQAVNFFLRFFHDVHDYRMREGRESPSLLWNWVTVHCDSFSLRHFHKHLK